MGIINDIIGFFVKRRGDRIVDFKNYPIETQERMFHNLISTAKNTDWGQKYNYRNIERIDQYQETVPISNYEEIYPQIERIIKGEKNVLWPSPVIGFAKSSGTTNARSKYIPVTSESLEECHYRGGKDMITFVFNNKPDTKVFDGKALSIAGSIDKCKPAGNVPVGDVSAILTKNLPYWAEFFRTPTINVALMDDWPRKLEKMIEQCSYENVTSVLGVPTWSSVLFDRILERTGKSNMLEVWPNFEFLIHGAVSFKPYRQYFKEKYFPSNDINYLETYNASEGFFGLQDDINLADQMLLMLDYGIFFEFVPMEYADEKYPKTLLLDEVELNKNYALIISTNGGLWRYKIGDTIKFTSLNPFRITVSGRTKHFINAFGEELIIENADLAIAKTSEITGISVNEYTAAPSYMNKEKKGKHEWIIETSKPVDDQEKFIDYLDGFLREINSDYDAKRSGDLALERPHIHFVKPGTFLAWMEKLGKLGGQNKVPRLSNERKYLEDLLTFI